MATAKKLRKTRTKTAGARSTAVDQIRRTFRPPDSLAAVLGESWVESAPGIYYRVPAQF